MLTSQDLCDSYATDVYRFAFWLSGDGKAAISVQFLADRVFNGCEVFVPIRYTSYSSHEWMGYTEVRKEQTRHYPISSKAWIRGPFLHRTPSATYGPSPKLTGLTVQSLPLLEGHNRKMATRVLTDGLS